jgi:hypothetical protein
MTSTKNAWRTSSEISAAHAIKVPSGAYPATIVLYRLNALG